MGYKKLHVIKSLSFIALLAVGSTIQAQTVTTFAGSGTSSSTDGTGTAAGVRTPRGICSDASGNLYVAEYSSNKIRKITPAAVVTTIAGSGTSGAADGTGIAASFNEPKGICVGAAGNIYVAEAGNHDVRKITPAGVVTTFAGSGAVGNADGTGTAAQFVGPAGICADAAGNLYVADFNGSTVRKITPAGVVTTLAGSSGVQGPAGICADAAGNIYVAEFNGNRIRKITPAGVVTTVAGSLTSGAADGTGVAASFFNPSGICIDASGNLYVADGGNQKIRKITPAGVVTTFAGSGSVGSADGVGTAASFRDPVSICITPSGNLYVAELNGHRIRKITTGVTGINPVDTAPDFVIYPNPASSGITVKCDESIQSIKVYNSTGSLVKTENRESFSVTTLPVGIYLLQIETSKGGGVVRFIKE